MYLASLLIGLAAWGISCADVLCGKKRSGISFSLCALAMLLQLCQVSALTDRGDYAAIEDTFPAIALAAGVLLAVTAVLNVLAALRRK